MTFMLISHGEKHLQLASDEGHRFVFHIVPRGRERRLAVGDVAWITGRQPDNSSHLLMNASHFASVCAEDYGLI